MNQTASPSGMPAWMPPRGIFVPTEIIFNTQLPSAVMVTWIKLRCLAWRGWDTPPLTLPELASLIGIHPGRLSKHISMLEGLSALSFIANRDGRIIVSFDAEPDAMAKNHSRPRIPAEPEFSHGIDREVSSSHSYFPRQIMGYLSIADEPDEFPPLDDAKYISLNVENSCIDQ